MAEIPKTEAGPDAVVAEPSSKVVTVYNFTAIHGIVVHPLPPRTRFNIGSVTPHEMDTFCSNMVRDGFLKVI